MWRFICILGAILSALFVGYRYFRAHPYDKSAAAKAQQELDAQAKSIELGERRFAGRTDPMSDAERRAKGL